MRKFIILPILLISLIFCGCTPQENSQTRLLLNTAVKITADCTPETLNGAFLLCENYEAKFSRTVNTSEVYRLNSGERLTVSDDTLLLIQRSLYYSKLTNGGFDITICPVSELWDFENQVIPENKDILQALQSVNYSNIEITSDTVYLNGSKIDLGSIAKGYIADRLREYLEKQGVESAVINLGGNVVTYGKSCTVGIKRPFGEDVIASITLQDKSAVTSGIYERYIKNGNQIYHHILDVKTGYGVQNELASATVIGESSLECDVLSTVCMVSGKEKALEIINSISNYEAVLIDRSGKIFLSNGLKQKNKKIYYK